MSDQTITTGASGLPPSIDSVDLNAIHADFDGVDTALRRLDEGTYWIDEDTGEPLAERLLAANPIARRAVD